MAITKKKFWQKNKDSTTDTWLTPPEIIIACGDFDLDPCCPATLPWTTAINSYSLDGRGEDGLALPWEGRVWLNPPYSNWVPFVKKLKEHGNGIALIFARTETRGFFDHVWNSADSILFLKRRIRFYKLDGTLGGSGTVPSVLIAYGTDNADKLEEASKTLEGKYIKLK